MDNNFLRHYGVLGMKWGVRRYQNKDGSRIGAKSRFRVSDEEIRKNREEARAKREVAEKKKRLEKERTEFYKGGWTKDYNEAAESHNKTINEINEKYDNVDLGFTDGKYVEDHLQSMTDEGMNYLHEMDDTWQKVYSDAIRKNHSTELAEEFIVNAPFMYEFAYDIYVAEEARKNKGGNQ